MKIGFKIMWTSCIKKCLEIILTNRTDDAIYENVAGIVIPFHIQYLVLDLKILKWTTINSFEASKGLLKGGNRHFEQLRTT